MRYKDFKALISLATEQGLKIEKVSELAKLVSTTRL